MNKELNKEQRQKNKDKLTKN